MRPLAFVFSGLGLLVFLPFGAIMVGFAHDAPAVSPLEAILRWALALSLLAIPLVWVASLATYLIIARRKIPTEDATAADLMQEFAARKHALAKQDRLLKWCALSPYYALALHLSFWVVLLVVPR